MNSSGNADNADDATPEESTDPALRGGVNPEDFLRALLRISAEDVEEVRERTPGTRPARPDIQDDDGPATE